MHGHQQPLESRSGGMADTPASGAGARKGVRVQLPASAPQHLTLFYQGSLSFPFFRTGEHLLLTFGCAEWLHHCKVDTQVTTL